MRKRKWDKRVYRTIFHRFLLCSAQRSLGQNSRTPRQAYSAKIGLERRTDSSLNRLSKRKNDRYR